MGDQSGVFISNTDVYHLLQDVQSRVIIIESTTETVKNDGERIRKLQAQVSAQWVIHSILLAFIVTEYFSK